MSSSPKISSELMMRFAERTGLTTDRPPQRYLWTDAFAVCNFLSLAQATGAHHYTELALRLVDQVHHTLGRHRVDDPRRGWISGLNEEEGAAHPTRGGLRIGKTLPERAADDPYDERLEWERDGQYFHYLTKWMHALDQVARLTGQAQYNLWARELAHSAFQAFTYPPSSMARGRRMVWKMSIDLSRPLVSSMGQHDPLDGYITAMQLQSSVQRWPQATREPDLDVPIEQYATMLEESDITTADPLGLGGLLMDAYRVAQLMQQGVRLPDHLLKDLLAAASTGLQDYVSSRDWRQPAEYRLAFRELGLSIGLHALARLRGLIGDALLEALLPFVSIGEEIESYWRRPEHRRAVTWSEHRDINDVMLATGLMPEGMLVLFANPAAHT